MDRGLSDGQAQLVLFNVGTNETYECGKRRPFASRLAIET